MSRRRTCYANISGGQYVLVALDHAELGPGFFRIVVVGDFPAQEARQFLNNCLQQDW